MNHAQIREVAELIAQIMGKHRPTAQEWDLIVKDVNHLFQPRVLLCSGNWSREYVIGSPALETAMNALMREGEKFTIEPVGAK